MAEKTPNPPVALQDDQDLWLVSYSDDDDREMSALSIAAALSRGEIDANTIVWRDGMPEWKAIAEVDVLKEQLRQVTASPENQRKRATVIGGFGPAQPFRGSTPAAPTPATQLPIAAPAPGAFDDDEPTIVQQTLGQGYGSSPNNATPGAAPSRSRHPTSGNTLRIRTGGEPVTMRTPTPAPQVSASDAEAAEPELESIPSALLITATNNTEVEEAVNAVKQRISTTPPLPTRGVMTRSSDPPNNRVSANLPRAALTRDGESDAPGPRITDAPKPPVPKRSLADGADSLSPDDLKSESDSSAPDAGPATPRYKTPLASVQIRDDVEQVYSADLQKTRPPRSRREPLIESGTPPPIGELSEVASRIARSTQSHAPVGAPLSEPQPKSSSGRFIGWALFGVAAVAGAFTLGKRSSEPAAEPTQPTAAVPTVAANAPTVNQANAAASAAPGASMAAVPETPAASAGGESTYISLATKPSPTPAVNAAASAKAAVPAPVRPTAIKPPAPITSAPTASPSVSANAGANAATSAAPAAAGEPGPFDSSAAANALALAANKASSCRQPGDPSGIARVTVTFTNSGKSTHALVDGPPFAGTATGGCIAATMRSTTVPAFTGDRVTVKKTVVIQ